MKLIIQTKPTMIRKLAVFLILISIALSSGCAVFKKKEVDTEQLSAEALYGDAKEAFFRENWNEVIEKLASLEARYPYGDFAKQAQLETAYARYKLGDDNAAVIAADRFISLNPTHPAVDYAYYIKGLASFKEAPGLRGIVSGRSNLSDRDPQAVNDALAAFNTVIQRYPESRYAPDSTKRISYLRSAKARHELSIAQFYYERTAYIAAVNRAKSIIENYANQPEIEGALGIMYLSYQHMQLPKLADDARRILELNYPNSGYLDIRADGKSDKRLLSSIFKMPKFLKRSK